MNDIQKDLIYLLFCGVNGFTPEMMRVQSMDLEKLYRLAASHSVRAAVCIALKSADVEDKPFDQAYKKAVRKNIYLDMERKAILSEFEKQGIWYMPLKGAVLKELYPENGMREMADNDILFDADRQEQVMHIMLMYGYMAESVGKSYHDVYHKPPMLNFELHTALFGDTFSDPFYRYYADTKRLLRRDEDSHYGYHFSDEDFYVYMTAHEWKDFNGGGTGVRSLLDCYVYGKVKGDTLDWAYITEQCRQLAIADFEQKRRQLAEKVFSADTLPDLTEQEQEMLMYYLTAGTYGKWENFVKKKLEDQSKAGFILRQMFPDIAYMRRSVAFVNKYPLLYPAGIVYRWGRSLGTHRKYLKRMVRTVRKYGK